MNSLFPFICSFESRSFERNYFIVRALPPGLLASLQVSFTCVTIPVVTGPALKTSVVVFGMSVTSAGFTADALHRKPLKLNSSLTKKMTFVPRSVVTMN